MEWKERLERYSEQIEDAVKAYLQGLEQEAADYHPFIGRCYSDFKELVLRKGKKIASCSTLLAYEGYTDRIDSKILKVCAGIELYRHSILVHDDLVDMDRRRRGGETFHEIYASAYDARFGDGAAVFSGNIALASAIQAMTESGFEKDEVSDAVSLLMEDYRAVNESQILDLRFEYEDVGVSEWHTMASKRAASLFRATILIGARLGGAPADDMKTLREAATNIGYSFDIQDDIIDTFADEEQYGRPPCGDIEQGKKPLHVLYALAHGKPSESEELSSYLGKDDLDQKEVDRVRALIGGTGGLDAAKDASSEHARKAKDLLADTDMNHEVVEIFESLISFVEESLDWYE